MHGLTTESLMRRRISSVRLNNVSSHFSSLLSDPASLHVSYQRLLQTIGVLEAQRTQAILDLETLARHQREALTDPISFVEQLQKQVSVIQTYVLLYTCLTHRGVHSGTHVSIRVILGCAVFGRCILYVNVKDKKHL